MTQAGFIAGDWGTSRLRLYLCGADGTVLDRREGEGAAVPDCAGRFAAAVADWDKMLGEGADGKLPAILGGMVGSTIGWKEVPYLECPARPGAIAGAALRFRSDGRAIAIAPGLKCTNPAGAPDVMRGEEVQILGALRLQPGLAEGRHLLCMPGTHVKWVRLEDGAVTRFQTALSGELFELLARHSVLARDGGAVDPESPAFALGLRTARDNAQAGLLHLLFSTRGRVVTGTMSKSEAASYLSGLIVGADVGAAVAMFTPPRVPLICSPLLAALYARALAAYGLDAPLIDGDAAALAGLVHIHADLMS
jgi:2-dehydro-3-deoxygalactonokinase